MSSVNVDDLLEVRKLVKYYSVTRGIIITQESGVVKAVDGISFKLKKGETLGLVGESGCGKSTLGHSILRLIEPTSGEIIFNGMNILNISKKKMRSLRSQMQIIFQDTYESLDPRQKVVDIIGEPLLVHGLSRGKEKEQKVKELMEIVGLSGKYIQRYPHEFSGGQRQRVGIARALSLNPKLIICDEAVSALDVSIQAQTINLLQELQQAFGLTYLFISHDLSVVKHISNRVAVMYLGVFVELTDKKTIYESPLHPYTKALISSIPIPNPKMKRKKVLLTGDIPNPINLPKGCRFHTRCHEVVEVCKNEEPDFINIGDQKEHFVACHVVQKAAGRF